MAGSLPQSGVSLVAQNAGSFLSSMRSAEGALGSFQSSAGAMSNIVTGAFRQVGTIITNVLAGAVRAVGTWLKASVGVAGDFEQTLNVLGATSGATGAQLEQVAQKAKELGADLTLPATSAQDAAQVMLELSKAGFSVQESMDAAKGALQLSAAAQVDAAAAAQITAGAINAFNLEATDAVRVADLLAAGANASSASMTDLAQGLQQAGFMFHAVGMPIEDLITSLAALTNVGLTGSDAGTALKNALVRLTNPTKKAAELMAKLGFNAYDATGKMKPMPLLITDLQKALAGMTDEQKNAALGTIFLSDGMKAMIPLLGLGADGFNALKDKVTVAGAAADVAGAQMKGWNGAVASTQSQLETLQLIIGTLIKNALTPLLFTVADIASKVVTFADRLAALLPIISASADPVRSFLSAIMLLAPGLNGIIFPLAQLYDTFAPIIGAFTDGDVSSRDLAMGLDLAQSALGRIGETAQTIGANIIAALPGVITSVGGIATGIITTIGERLPGIIDGLTTWRGAFLNSITPALPGIITSVGTVAANIITAIGGALPGIIAALSRWSFAFLDWLLQASPGLLGALVTTGLQVVTAIGTALPGIIEALAQWGAKFVQWVIDAMPKMFATLLDLDAKILAWIVEKAPGILAKLAEWGAKFVLWVVQTVPKLIVALGEMLAQLIAWVFNHRQQIADALVKWGNAFVTWIGETAIPGILTALGNLWNDLKAWISETAGKIGADDSVGSAIVSGIRKGISDAWEGLKKWFMGKIQGLLDSAKGLIGAGSPSRVWADEFGKPIPQGAAMGIDEAMDLVRNSIGRMISAATAQATSGAADIYQALAQMSDGYVGSKAASRRPSPLNPHPTSPDANKTAPRAPQRPPPLKTPRPTGPDANTTAQHVIGSIYEALSLFGQASSKLIGKIVAAPMRPPPLKTPRPTGPDSIPALQRPSPVVVQAPQTNHTSYQMPIYTNQSPAVLSQSLALIEALTA